MMIKKTNNRTSFTETKNKKGKASNEHNKKVLLKNQGKAWPLRTD